MGVFGFLRRPKSHRRRFTGCRENHRQYFPGDDHRAPFFYDLESLDIALDALQRGLDYQFDEISALDTKTNFTLTAATLLAAGFAAIGQNALPDETIEAVSLEGAFVLASLSIYLLLVFTGWQAYRVRDFERPYEPSELLASIQRPPPMVKLELADGVRFVLETNQIRVREKARWAVRAERLLLVEAAWIALIAGLWLVRQ